MIFYSLNLRFDLLQKQIYKCFNRTIIPVRERMAETNKNIKLTFLGKMGQVGGNMVLFEDSQFDTHIILDFGMCIGLCNKLYPKEISPSSVQELIENTLLPDPVKINIPDLYRTSIQIKSPNSKQIDAILISHPHKDHYYGLPFLNRKIPVYTGVITRAIIESLAQSELQNSLNDFRGIDWRTFRTNDVIQIKNLVIVPFHVDHSVPASYGFIIYSSIGPIVYTGDFRRHGPLAHMTEEFLDQIKTHQMYKSWLITHPDLSPVCLDRVKLIISEGTKINKGIVESEEFVANDLESLSKMNPFDFMIIKYERTDWDRFRTFSNFAKEHKWKFVLSERDAYFYYILNKDSFHGTMQDPNIINEDHILILKRFNATYPWQEEFRKAMYLNKKGFRLIDSIDDLSLRKPNNAEDASKFMFYITHLTPDHKSWIQSQPQSYRGVFISSSVDPYSEQIYDDTDYIGDIVLDFGMPTFKVHASGHVNCHALIDFIDQVNPEKIIPIHTEHPELFVKLFVKNKADVILPKQYDSIEL